MSAITSIGTVLVPVADQEAALAFWTGLGFETRLDAEFAPGQRWVEVGPPGAETSLALVPDDGHARSDPDGNPFRVVERPA